MKRIITATIIFSIFFISTDHLNNFSKASNTAGPMAEEKQGDGSDNEKKQIPSLKNLEYRFPEFYRGIYLNIGSATNKALLEKFVKMCKDSFINTMVLDVQSNRTNAYSVPSDHVKYLIDNSIHPIARIVVFADGLKNYPVQNSLIEARIEAAEKACQSGFREIQFDYIRFNDSERNRHLTLNERYSFIEGFLLKARKRLQKYNAKIAADVFGRIPLNSGDIIGQRMEGLDNVVDIICPMAYPSHYTWSKKFYLDPYYTVYTTSVNAKKRVKKAEIVSYIQAFKMKLYDIPYTKYIRDQIAAVHDAGIKGFLFWNAQQVYDIPLDVTRSFYLKKQEPVKTEQKRERL